MEQRKGETGLKLLCYCCCYQVTFLFSSSVSVPCGVNQWVEEKRKEKEKNWKGIMGIVVVFPGGIFGCCDYIVLTDTWLSI